MPTVASVELRLSSSAKAQRCELSLSAQYWVRFSELQSFLETYIGSSSELSYTKKHTEKGL